MEWYDNEQYQIIISLHQKYCLPRPEVGVRPEETSGTTLLSGWLPISSAVNLSSSILDSSIFPVRSAACFCSSTSRNSSLPLLTHWGADGWGVAFGTPIASPVAVRVWSGLCRSWPLVAGKAPRCDSFFNCAPNCSWLCWVFSGKPFVCALSFCALGKLSPSVMRLFPWPPSFLRRLARTSSGTTAVVTWWEEKEKNKVMTNIAMQRPNCKWDKSLMYAMVRGRYSTLFCSGV